MFDQDKYPTSQGVEDAIREAAKKAATSNPSLDVSKQIRLEYFNRFLSRIFSEGTNTDWILKGGTGMLARVPSARATRDIDLAIRGFTLDEALSDLVRLSKINLGDHFLFEYLGHAETMGNDLQPYADGYRVNFNIFIGVSLKGPLQIDLAVGSVVTGEVTRLEPANALPLPRLVSHPYRLYPLVDQIADKVCATMREFNQGVSTREKDLVDLVVLAKTHDIDGAALQYAILVEAQRRRMSLPTRFAVPASWGRGYAKLAMAVPHCEDYPNVEMAVNFVAKFLEPVLSGTMNGRLWSHRTLEWV